MRPETQNDVFKPGKRELWSILFLVYIWLVSVFIVANPILLASTQLMKFINKSSFTILIHLLHISFCVLHFPFIISLIIIKPKVWCLLEKPSMFHHKGVVSQWLVHDLNIRNSCPELLWSRIPELGNRVKKPSNVYDVIKPS